MRKGAASTVRSLAEQVHGHRTNRQGNRPAHYGSLAAWPKRWRNKRKTAQEITAAASDLDKQTQQASRAMKEQAAGFKQITDSSANITKQIKLIAAANLENSRSTTVILERIQEVRDVSRDNGEVGQKHRSASWGKPAERRPSLKRRTAEARPRRPG